VWRSYNQSVAGSTTVKARRSQKFNGKTWNQTFLYSSGVGANNDEINYQERDGKLKLLEAKGNG
jgi:hypothetical protein